MGDLQSEDSFGNPEPEVIDEAVKTILKEFDPWVSVFLSSRGIQVKEIEITPKTDLSYMGTEVIITIRGETLGYYDP